MRRGHILPNEIEERNALVSKYYSMLESSVNPTFRSTLEGYKVLPPMDKEKYQARDGLEGPFSTLSGKVVYYDPKAGSYYDPDTDMYISYSDFQKLDNDYSGIGDEEADDFVKDIEPKETSEETVKGPRGHLRSIVADDLNEIDCWDGYRKDGTKPGTGKNKGKRVNNCVKVKEDEVNEEHDIGLLKAVARQMEADAHKGDYTAIEELLQDVSTEELKAFLSDHRDIDMDEGGEGSGPKHKEVTVTKDGKSKVVKKIAAKVFTDAGWKVEEGKSPHKKGTEKYKKHMAAMHAG